jgi:hypothetical protein
MVEVLRIISWSCCLALLRKSAVLGRFPLPVPLMGTSLHAAIPR